MTSGPGQNAIGDTVRFVSFATGSNSKKFFAKVMIAGFNSSTPKHTTPKHMTKNCRKSLKIVKSRNVIGEI